jgi:hypothetical protein
MSTGPYPSFETGGRVALICLQRSENSAVVPVAFDSSRVYWGVKPRPICEPTPFSWKSDESRRIRRLCQTFRGEGPRVAEVELGLAAIIWPACL